MRFFFSFFADAATALHLHIFKELDVYVYLLLMSFFFLYSFFILVISHPTTHRFLHFNCVNRHPRPHRRRRYHHSDISFLFLAHTKYAKSYSIIVMSNVDLLDFNEANVEPLFISSLHNATRPFCTAAEKEKKTLLNLQRCCCCFMVLDLRQMWMYARVHVCMCLVRVRIIVLINANRQTYQIQVKKTNK